MGCATASEYINSVQLPVWFRPYSFKLYAHAFGCNLDQIDPPDLQACPSLDVFFGRKLKDGVRPIDPAILVPFLLLILPSLSDFFFLVISEPCRWDSSSLWYGRKLKSKTSQGRRLFFEFLLGVERPGPSYSTSSNL